MRRLQATAGAPEEKPSQPADETPFEEYDLVEVEVAAERFQLQPDTLRLRCRVEPLSVFVATTLPGLLPGQPKVVWFPFAGTPGQLLARIEEARQDLNQPTMDPQQPRRQYTRVVRDKQERD